jgi:CO/xanthine dehydrogenase FAD-binding subunit
MRYSHADMHAPVSLPEALMMMAEKPGAYKILAGGTDLMVEMSVGKYPQTRFLSLHRIRDLLGIQVDDQFVTIGAMTSFREILNHDVLAREFHNLHEAARWVGAAAIQNRATLGGNIGNASPAADAPPALICYDAEIELSSVRGSRWLPYSEFHLGYKLTAAAADEIITRVRLPRGRGLWKNYYRKVGPRKALSISKVSMAACAKMRDGRVEDVCIALGSVAPTVIRTSEVEALLKGKVLNARMISEARDLLVTSLKPIDDIRSTAEYRSTVAGNLLVEFLETLL